MSIRHRVLRGLLLAAGFALSLAAARPADAAAITVTVTGVIDGGSDVAGVFTGVPGTSLAGRPATLVQSFTVTPATLIDAQPDHATALFEALGLSVTVDGVTLAFTTASGFGSYELFSAAFNFGLSQIAATSGLPIAGGGQVAAFSEVLDTASELFALPPDLFQDFTFTWPGPASLSGSFLAAAFEPTGALTWNFGGTATSVLVRYDAGIPVPAPAALGLLALGLAGLAVARRRG